MVGRWVVVGLGLVLGCAPRPPCDEYAAAAGACYAEWGVEWEPSCDPDSDVGEAYLLCVAAVYDETDCAQPDAFVTVRGELARCLPLLLEEL